jgi:hypothetical protein
MVGLTVSATGRIEEYLCNHPQVNGQTTPAQCTACRYFQEKPAVPTAPAPRVASGEPPRMATIPSGQPRGVVVNRYGDDAGIEDLWLGATAVYVLGGPSLAQVDWSLLGRRGVLIMAQNNCLAALPMPLRPHLWLHTDDPQKFSYSMWRDPGILKLVPVREWKLDARRWEGDHLEFTGIPVRHHAGVLGFHRNTEFRPAEFLTEPSVNRGNDEKNAKGLKGRPVNGWPHVINTMFAGLRLAYYVGIRRLLLIGADWRMTTEKPYGIDEAKPAGAVRGMNRTFAQMEIMLAALQPVFEAAGFHVLNATPGSRLEVFPRVDLTAAIEEATAGIEQETLRTRGYYVKQDRDEANSQPDPEPVPAGVQSAFPAHRVAVIGRRIGGGAR